MCTPYIFLRAPMTAKNEGCRLNIMSCMYIEILIKARSKNILIIFLVYPHTSMSDLA